ncbi:MAG: HAD family hydrolase [Gammaproteobacteria bacterium]|nr:HAD family hydrolase [Gammaproteobacteria bacterium]
MSIKGILFDKDGTLLDFHATWMPAYESAAAMVCERARRPGLESHLLAVGGYDAALARCDPGSLLACGTTAELARLWAREAGMADAGALEAMLEEVFQREVGGKAVPVPELPALFRRLKERGLALGIATMDSEALARSAARQFGIEPYLSFVCGYDSGFGEKPGPGMAEAFCRHVALAPGDIVVVGDTPHDLHMGRAAGAGLVIGVLSGASTHEILAPHSDRVLDSVRALEELLV